MVSGFSFARGNAAKLLALPLYAAGNLASVVVRRRPGHWVFGSGPGIGEGALALYRQVAAESPARTLTWLAKDRADLAHAAELGIPALLKSSRAGFLSTLRAQVVVVTHGFGDANRYGVRGAFIVQLWHGIPLKLIQLDSSATTRLPVPGGRLLASAMRRALARGFSGIDLMPAASEAVAVRLRTAFGLPGDRVVVTGDPRDDVLSRGTADDRRTVARAAVTRLIGELPPRVILFAPTWRDGQPDPAAPDAAQWRTIADYLEATDSLLVVRPHHLGVGDYAVGPGISDRIRMLGSDLLVEVTPALPAFDLLVTDYSSIAFDFSLTGGGILFLAADVEAYLGSRGLYEPYADFSGGRSVADWPAMVHQLGRFDSDATWRARVLAHTVDLRERYFAFTDGGNTARVSAAIAERTA